MKLEKFNKIIENAIQSFTNREIDNNPEKYCWDTTSVSCGDTSASFSTITDSAEQEAREYVCENFIDDILDVVKDELSIYIPQAVEDEGFLIDLEKIIERRV